MFQKITMENVLWYSLVSNEDKYSIEILHDEKKSKKNNILFISEIHTLSSKLSVPLRNLVILKFA